jgi:hypothetical protein
MRNGTRFEKLARGCFALTLSLAEWLELERILATSRKARRMFKQRARRRSLRFRAAANSNLSLFTGPGGWLRATRFQ